MLKTAYKLAVSVTNTPCIESRLLHHHHPKFRTKINTRFSCLIADNDADWSIENRSFVAIGASRQKNRPLLGIWSCGSSVADGHFCSHCPLVGLHLVSTFKRYKGCSNKNDKFKLKNIYVICGISLKHFYWKMNYTLRGYEWIGHLLMSFGGPKKGCSVLYT